MSVALKIVILLNVLPVLVSHLITHLHEDDVETEIFTVIHGFRICVSAGLLTADGLVTDCIDIPNEG